MANFDLAYLVSTLPLLWEGMQVTLLLTVLGIIGGLTLGAILAVLRMSRSKLLARAATLYVTFFRAVPILLGIFWFYFLMPLWLGHPIDGFNAALLGFVLFEAAYFCEIIRAGIQSVRHGQILAGLASGLSHGQTMRAIVLPQALRNMLPVLVTQSINLFKGTALVYVVGVRDFLTAADIVGTRDNQLIAMYCLVAVVYFILCLTGSLLATRLQRRYAI
jgi:glutamate/aspartate transport system permease protein